MPLTIQMKSTGQYGHVVLFIVLNILIVTEGLWVK